MRDLACMVDETNWRKTMRWDLMFENLDAGMYVGLTAAILAGLILIAGILNNVIFRAERWGVGVYYYDGSMRLLEGLRYRDAVRIIEVNEENSDIIGHVLVGPR